MLFKVTSVTTPIRSSAEHPSPISGTVENEGNQTNILYNGILTNKGCVPSIFLSLCTENGPQPPEPASPPIILLRRAWLYLGWRRILKGEQHSRSNSHAPEPFSTINAYQHLPHQTQDLVSAKPDRGTSTELTAKAQAQAQARARALQIAADPPCWNCGRRDDEGSGGGKGRRATRICAGLRAVLRIG